MTGGRHKNWNELQLHDNVSNLVPGERLAITTTTVIPNYTCEPRFGVALMLSWKQGTEGNYVAQIFGEMILSVQDVLNPEARKPIFQSRVCQHVSLSTLETQVQYFGGKFYKRFFSLFFEMTFTPERRKSYLCR